MENSTAASGEAFTLPGNSFIAPKGKMFKEWAIGSEQSEIRVNAGNTHSFTADTTVYAIWEEIPEDTYKIIVQIEGSGTATANPEYAVQGTEITLTQIPDNGYRFKEWQVISVNAEISGNKFIMPAGEVTVKAVFEAIPDPDPVVLPVTPTVPVISYDEKSSSVSTEIKAQTDAASGTATAKVSTATVTALLNKAAQEKAKTVVIKVDAAAGATRIEAVLPGDAFRKIADKKVDVSIASGFATVIFDDKAVENISSANAAGDIGIGVAQANKAFLTAEMQNRVGDRPVYDFTVKAGNTEISEFGPGGKTEISIPYTLKPGEKKNSVVAYRIDNSGKLQAARGKYDDASGRVIFTVEGALRYAVGYHEVNFSDVERGSRYDEAIGFMAARGIISGTGNGKFAPENSITRADLLIMVMNTYGIEPDARDMDNFADAGNKYYTAYLATAKRLGLVSGIGNNLFAPEKIISKQDTLVILHNILEKLGELPSEKTGKTLDGFSDAKDIAAYAIEAIKWFAEKGIEMGEGKRLSPKANFTRAQVAQILYSLF